MFVIPILQISVFCLFSRQHQTVATSLKFSVSVAAEQLRLSGHGSHAKTNVPGLAIPKKYEFKNPGYEMKFIAVLTLYFYPTSSL